MRRGGAGRRKESAGGEPPSARGVPIPAVPLAALADVVIIAPMIARIEKMTEMAVPR